MCCSVVKLNQLSRKLRDNDVIEDVSFLFFFLGCFKEEGWEALVQKDCMLGTVLYSKHRQAQCIYLACRLGHG